MFDIVFPSLVNEDFLLLAAGVVVTRSCATLRLYSIEPRLCVRQSALDASAETISKVMTDCNSWLEIQDLSHA